MRNLMDRSVNGVMSLGRRELKIMLPLIVVAFVAVSSYATTVTVSSSTYQAQYGVSYDISGSFTAQDQGFATASSSQTASTLPCSWSNNGNCQNALTKSHYRYLVKLTLNIVPASTTTYTVTMNWAQNGGAVTQLCQLTVSVPNTAGTSQTMNFICDTGSASFATPLAIDVTVA